MKAASAFEVIAARGWNLLNEGKSFYPIFNLGLLAVLVAADPAWRRGALAGGGAGLALALLASLPLVLAYIRWDFPLHLRWFLWPPLLAFGLLFGWPPAAAVGLSAGLYFFFTVIVWGTIYYHLRTGTTLWNFLRFWKLVLKNADSTSGNAQEQLPKSFLTLAVWHHLLARPGTASAAAAGRMEDLLPVFLFALAVAAYGAVVHRLGFNWRPAEYPDYAPVPPPLPQPSQRVVVIVIDGCRKDKLERAETPFLDWLAARGTRFDRMETVYPARTVVCFSSMFTGTYPREHGITSNLVLRLGVRDESAFDVLARYGRKGVLLGIAHLIDAFGDHVRAITSVQNGDEVDGNIMAAAREILQRDDPDLLVVQLIATDQTGHARGVHYPEYLQRIREADAHIEAFFAWMHRHGYTRDTTFLICADHGQGDGIGGHGHLGEGERWVPFFLVGRNVARGRRSDQAHSIVSVAGTLTHLLGLPLPARARGPVLEEALDPGAPDLAPDLDRYFAAEGRAVL
ncbi:sulfatase-like hydrolase/transferase [Thermaerobacter sp. PB12/4term]|uniref:alkaline phosphatase family protein n=1 Tax=Thermaerobacter sp. PB12/4term TaxID=2293838 RepID=UPI000E3274E4|nr:alkaline phosphatase family protein [Thermaerobacter sp. PB12/4term]QIA26508.1 sulfatase-like hydrolase/transferase [Thermaerobacter sp. PB12/4term]